MLKRFIASVFLLFSMLAMCSSTAWAASGYKSTPLAFQLFCLKHPEDCRKSGSNRVVYSAKVKALLANVNTAVNRSIRPRREKRDVWTLNPGVGDCDDYVVTKRHRLIDAGLPSSALKVAVVRTRSGEGHAILLVSTSAGEFALDNLRSQIVARNRTGYRILTVSAGHP